MSETMKKLKIFAERQAKGDTDQNNFRNIIGGLRHYTHGIQSMREIADFYAHEEGRNKGIATKHCQDFFDMMTFKMPQIEGKGIGPDFPPTMKKVAKYVFAELDSSVFKNDLKMNRKEASIALKSALDKFVDNNGLLTNKYPLSNIEFKVLQTCLSYLIVRSAFTQNSLISDYVRLLKANKLIDNKNESAVMQLSPDLIMHFMCTVQTMTLDIGPSQTAKINLMIDEKGKLNVGAVSSIPYKGGKLDGYGHLVTTEMKASDWIGDEFYSDANQTQINKDKFKVGGSYDAEYFAKNGTYPPNYTFKGFIEVKNRKIRELI